LRSSNIEIHLCIADTVDIYVSFAH